MKCHYQPVTWSPLVNLLTWFSRDPWTCGHLWNHTWLSLVGKLPDFCMCIEITISPLLARFWQSWISRQFETEFWWVLNTHGVLHRNGGKKASPFETILVRGNVDILLKKTESSVTGLSGNREKGRVELWAGPKYVSRRGLYFLRAWTSGTHGLDSGPSSSLRQAMQPYPPTGPVFWEMHDIWVILILVGSPLLCNG